MNVLNRMLLCAVFVPAIAFVGCDNKNLPATVPAEGVVTLDGKEVEGATVVFIADQGSYNATGITDANGKFQLSAFDEKTGAVPGSYKVEINKTIIERKGESKGEAMSEVRYGLPAKYATIAKSGLEFTIPEKGDKNIKIELKSK